MNTYYLLSKDEYDRLIEKVSDPTAHITAQTMIQSQDTGLVKQTNTQEGHAELMGKHRKHARQQENTSSRDYPVGVLHKCPSKLSQNRKVAGGGKQVGTGVKLTSKRHPHQTLVRESDESSQSHSDSGESFDSGSDSSGGWFESNQWEGISFEK